MKSALRLISLHGRNCPRETVLEIRNLTKRFSASHKPLEALADVSFTAGNGELICILGRSGCGKTTLLKAVAGFIRPTAGSVLLDGLPVSGPGPDRCMVFQEDALFPWLTVRENIGFGLKRRGMGRKRRGDAVERFLSLVGLERFGDYLPAEVSGGMKQRVALARVLILEPKVLLMDEPFAALDAQTREEMQNLLLSLWEKFSHTILFVTHDVNEAVTLAGRVLVMDRDPGRIRKEMSIDLGRPRLREAEAFSAIYRRLHDAL